MTDISTTASRDERILARRRTRMATSPTILRGGFRAFFFLGAAWGIVALVLWLCALLGGLELPSGFDPLTWHRHEMLFGFVGAMVTGFLLTAIPNWTGRPPIAGAPLAGLAGLWLAGRLAVFCSSELGPALAAAIDVGLYAVLAVVGAREILAAKNRNLPLVAMVLLFGAASAMDHAGAAGLIADGEAGFRAGIALVIVMIAVIGGRIVPTFTRNWLTKRGAADRLPPPANRFDLLTVAATAVALLSWALLPSTLFTGGLLIGASLLQAARLVRWSGWRTARDPLVLILHVGYLWVPVGLLLLGWSIFGAGIPRTVAIHALTAGAMATMILAVTTRATLGHTGRELRASPLTVLAYALVTLGALLRVAAPLGLTDYRTGMEAAGALWAGAFVLFLIVYTPIVVRPRADGAPG